MAYRFFQGYGATLDTTRSISSNLSLNGTFTYTGTLSGNLTGTESQNFSVSLTGNLGNGSQSGDGSPVGFTFSSVPIQYQDLELTITPETGGHNYAGNFSCTFNGEPSINSTMTCTNRWYEPTTGYEVTLDHNFFNPVTVNSGTISISSTESGGGTATGTISLQENLSGGGNGAISITGTDSTTLHKVYDIPFLTFPATPDNTVNDAKRFFNSWGNPFTIVFLSRNQLTTGLFGSFTDNKGFVYNYDDIEHKIKTIRSGAYCVNVFEYYLPRENGGTTSQTFSGELRSLVGEFIPLYTGYKNSMSDDLYRIAYNGSRYLDAINNMNTTINNNIHQEGVYDREAIYNSAENQIENAQNIHNEQMSTNATDDYFSSSNQNGVSSIVSTAEQKTGSLFFPIQFVIDTAYLLSNVPDTGQIWLPGIWTDEMWLLDLTVIERNLGEAWTFIQLIIQIGVCVPFVYSLYNLIQGKGE